MASVTRQRSQAPLNKTLDELKNSEEQASAGGSVQSATRELLRFRRFRGSFSRYRVRFTPLRDLLNWTFSHAFRSKTRYSPQSPHTESRSIHLRFFRRNRRRTRSRALVSSRRSGIRHCRQNDFRLRQESQRRSLRFRIALRIQTAARGDAGQRMVPTPHAIKQKPGGANSVLLLRRYRLRP